MRAPLRKVVMIALSFFILFTTATTASSFSLKQPKWLKRITTVPKKVRDKIKPPREVRKALKHLGENTDEVWVFIRKNTIDQVPKVVKKTLDNTEEVADGIQHDIIGPVAGTIGNKIVGPLAKGFGDKIVFPVMEPIGDKVIDPVMKTIISKVVDPVIKKIEKDPVESIVIIIFIEYCYADILYDAAHGISGATLGLKIGETTVCVIGGETLTRNNKNMDGAFLMTDGNQIEVYHLSNQTHELIGHRKEDGATIPIILHYIYTDIPIMPAGNMADGSLSDWQKLEYSEDIEHFIDRNPIEMYGSSKLHDITPQEQMLVDGLSLLGKIPSSEADKLVVKRNEKGAISEVVSAFTRGTTKIPENPLAPIKEAVKEISKQVVMPSVIAEQENFYNRVNKAKKRLNREFEKYLRARLGYNPLTAPVLPSEKDWQRATDLSEGHDILEPAPPRLP